MSDMITKQRVLVDYFQKLGVRYINVLPVFAPEEGSESPLFKWDALEFAKNFYDAHIYAKEKGIWYNTMCIVNFDEKTRIACRSCTPCPHLTTDGYVSSCDFTQLGPEYIEGPLSQLIYGKYDKEKDIIIYDEDAMHRIRSRCVENLKKDTCKDCEYIYNCAGGCMGQVVNETGSILGKIEDKELKEYLDREFEEYCTCDDYYEPVVEDFEFEYYLTAWSKKNGFKVKAYEGEGHDGGYEPSVRRGGYW